VEEVEDHQHTHQQEQVEQAEVEQEELEMLRDQVYLEQLIQVVVEEDLELQMVYQEVQADRESLF
jgi:hypothetical protein